MKKTLVISVVLGMYVLLCGCPYEFTGIGPASIYPTPINVDVLVNAGTPTNNVPFWYGKFNSGIPAYFKFINITQPGATPIYTILSQFDTTSTSQLLDTCYFSTVNYSDGGNATMMEIVQYSQNSKTNYNHIFSIISTNPDQSLNFLPLPLSITNSSYLSPPLNPMQVQQVVQLYLKNIFGVKPVYPLNTDVGIDNDSEIKGLTSCINVIKKSDTTGGTKMMPSAPGSHHWSRSYKIMMIIGAFILGLFFGYYVSRKRK
jgi:hypothetical protein